jgi:hypothetical protein
MHPIWKIKLFNKLENNKAECIECKKNVGRDVFDYRRTSLTPDKAKMLVFLNQAIPKIGKY